ncbi:myrosinase 1-like [Sitodiplosis mosellana]|uniref:myrosinase 1-like n=1 Tax=Sitodiplosis mosellana TaxID=263140 RepID=UPI002443B7E8|nr:myrosinase 1-like [Sitodiplosis mosellana]
MLKSILICILGATIATKAPEVVVDSRQNASDRFFPGDFLFGASTAAYQIEGAWNLDGKGPNIWDEFTHSHPEKIVDHENADVTTNSYEFYLDDVEAVKNLSMNFYRISIAWSRILPTGDIANINEKGIEYYNKLIDAIINHKLEPMVTMYHYDLPQDLQKLGGLTNSIVISYFEAYANLLYDRFGDRVKYWITFNEPGDFCTAGYGADQHAPAVNAHGVGEYLCGHNVLKAHAVAYRLYRSSYYEQYKGQVGITLSSRFFYSDSNDTHTVDRAMQFSLGWFANPIFSPAGNYPAIMITSIASNSIREGRSWSRLPSFTDKWIETIRGSADFLGLNYYTSRYVEVNPEPKGTNPSYERDINLKFVIKPEWKPSASNWLYSVPKGIGDILRWIKEEYNNPEVFITENGWSDHGELDDDDRIAYLHDHLEQILDVVLSDESNLKGYTVWSIIDNFEWTQGYTEKFGLYSVNMSSPRRERTAKKSANFMATVASTHRIPEIN